MIKWNFDNVDIFLKKYEEFWPIRNELANDHAIMPKIDRKYISVISADTSYNKT